MTELAKNLIADSANILQKPMKSARSRTYVNLVEEMGVNLLERDTKICY